MQCANKFKGDDGMDTTDTIHGKQSTAKGCIIE